MIYKGYTATSEIDEGAGILFGALAGIQDVITLEGDTVAEFIPWSRAATGFDPRSHQAFHDSVDDYLEWCAERGEAPRVPQTGTPTPPPRNPPPRPAPATAAAPGAGAPGHPSAYLGCQRRRLGTLDLAAANSACRRPFSVASCSSFSSAAAARASARSRS